MSRSYRKHDICGNAGRSNSSEKDDKRIANRILRRNVRMLLHANPEEEVLPVMNEVRDPWDMNKDGKSYFGNLLSEHVRRGSRGGSHNEGPRAVDPYWIKIYRKMKGK